MSVDPFDAIPVPSVATVPVTVQLLSGEQLIMEVLPFEFYIHLYHRIKERLPEEVRPRCISQMCLLLGGEMVPYHQMVKASEEVYHLLIDPTVYKIKWSYDDLRDRQMTVRLSLVCETAGEPESVTELATMVYRHGDRYSRDGVEYSRQEVREHLMEMIQKTHSLSVNAFKHVSQLLAKETEEIAATMFYLRLRYPFPW